ncbi:RNA polymerase II transcription mediator complex subunit 9-domain-containing protein [Aspergillus karnatakaensis]|uniref:RNA polymerase II mediator complex middle subunit MED9 n=1 Tax=Aspergillus karnatakaensis TaxID=1810916 RepID=UPI003CCDA700
MASRSPTAATPAGPKSSAPDTPLIKDAPATPQTVVFPPPQTFDFIPPLHGLILRLLSPQTNAAGAVNGDTEGAGQAQSQQQQSTSAVGNENNNADLLAAVSSSAPNPTSAAVDIAALSSNMPPPLDIKNLPTEVSSIKIRIQKAQAVVENLPDVHRTVTEQEEEIRQLEARITKLKSVISDFGRRANSTGFEKAQASDA